MKRALFGCLIAFAATAGTAADGLSKLRKSSEEDAKRAVREHLKDPDSAKFRNLTHSKEGITIICGEVNAKNSYGGYAGFERFVSAGSAAATSLEKSAPGFDHMWDKFCS